MKTAPTAIQTNASDLSLAQKIAKHVFICTPQSLPAEAFAKAELHLLDTFGLALASYSQDYAAPSLAGICAAAGQGDCFVIGSTKRLASRDVSGGYTRKILSECTIKTFTCAGRRDVKNIDGRARSNCKSCG